MYYCYSRSLALSIWKEARRSARKNEGVGVGGERGVPAGRSAGIPAAVRGAASVLAQ
jgi:hypothetical protein